MAIYTHTAVAILALAVGAAGAWQTQNWRYGEKIADINAQQARLISEAEQSFRKKEQALVAARQQSEVRYVQEKRKAADAAVGAQSELDRLRDVLAKPSVCQTPSDPAAAERAAGAARLERDLLGACAKALTDLAVEADRLESKIVGLQSYVKDVCLAK